MSNIQNTAEYSATGSSFSAGVGSQKGASAGNSNLSDDSNSVTVSAISAGTVNITNNTAQTANTGKDAVTTVANINRDVQTSLQTTEDGRQIATAVDSSGNNLAGTLTPIFDQAQIQRELQAQVQITQAFSQVAPRAVGDYAGNKVKELIAQGNTAEAAKWDEGGIYRIALHTALGGLLTGDISGALGAGAVAGAAPLLNELQTKVTEALTQAGASNPVASSIAQVLAELTSVGIGSAIGGTAGAGAALVVDTNNRQLHITEIALARQRAKDFARQLNNGKEPTAAQIDAAENRLLAQINRNANQNSDFYYDGTAQTFLISVARDYTIQTGSSNILGTNEPIFGLAISQESYLSPSIFANMLNTATLQTAYQDIASVYNDPNKPGIYLPNNYWTGGVQEYNQQTTVANLGAVAIATCMTTRIGCSALSGLQAGEGVNQVQAGNNWGWLNIALGTAGGVLSTLPSGLGRLTVSQEARGLAYENPSQLVQTRADELLAQIPESSRGRITMGVAVLEDSNGVRTTVISTSEPRGYLRPGVRINSGEVMVAGTGHAEADIIAYANANGFRVVNIGATRPVCVGCQNTIAPTGANISTPIKLAPKITEGLK